MEVLVEARIGERRLAEVGQHVDAGGEDLGTGDISLLDHVIHPDVEIAAYRGALHGGDARLQGPVETLQRASVPVGVEEAGHQMPASQVQHMGPLGRRIGADGLDEPVADHHHGVLQDGAVHDVHHVGVHERDVGLRQDGVLAGEVGDRGLRAGATGGEDYGCGQGRGGKPCCGKPCCHGEVPPEPDGMFAKPRGRRRRPCIEGPSWELRAVH